MRSRLEKRAMDGQVALVTDLKQLLKRRVIGIQSKFNQEIFNSSYQTGQTEGSLVCVPSDGDLALRRKPSWRPPKASSSSVS